jgi:hypothetical protein
MVSVCRPPLSFLAGSLFLEAYKTGSGNFRARTGNAEKIQKSYLKPIG